MNLVYFSGNSLLNLIYIQKSTQIIIEQLNGFSQHEHTHVTSTHESILFLKKKSITPVDDEFLLLFVSFTQCLALQSLLNDIQGSFDWCHQIKKKMILSTEDFRTSAFHFPYLFNNNPLYFCYLLTLLIIFTPSISFHTHNNPRGRPSRYYLSLCHSFGN